MTAFRIGRLDVQIGPGTLTLAGRIDDAASLGDLVPRLVPGDLVIDTGGVTFVNSIGMREWMRLIRAVRERGGAITLVRVADVLMTQMNLIPEFSKSVSIASFHAQYVCPKCGAEAAPIVDAIANAQALRQLVAPGLPCGECGAQMELGDFPERYLSIFRD